MSSGPPAPLHVDDLLKEVVNRQGSDLHLLDGLPPKVRVHGALEPLDVPPPSVQHLVEPVLDARHKEIFERFGETDLAYAVEGAGRFRVHTPLIQLTKAEIIRRGMELGVDYSLTHSCYDPDPAGRPCGECDSCRLRRKGFEEAGAEDPLPYSS